MEIIFVVHKLYCSEYLYVVCYQEETRSMGPHHQSFSSNSISRSTIFDVTAASKSILLQKRE